MRSITYSFHLWRHSRSDRSPASAEYQVQGATRTSSRRELPDRPPPVRGRRGSLSIGLQRDSVNINDQREQVKGRAKPFRPAKARLVPWHGQPSGLPRDDLRNSHATALNRRWRGSRETSAVPPGSCRRQTASSRSSAPAHLREPASAARARRTDEPVRNRLRTG